MLIELHPDDHQAALLRAETLMDLGRFLYVITRLLRPKLVLETGCFVGYSSLCMA